MNRPAFALLLALPWLALGCSDDGLGDDVFGNDTSGGYVDPNTGTFVPTATATTPTGVVTDPVTGTTVPTSTATATATGTNTATTTATGTTTTATTTTITNTLVLEEHTPAYNCSESISGNLTLGQDGKGYVSGGGKTYAVRSNWWHRFVGQTVTSSGANFSVSGSSGTTTNDSNPAGFPTIFIGAYDNQGTAASGLPIGVSQIQSIPTVLRTNGLSYNQDYYNFTYDVWFTTSGTVSGYDPGAGGAYLMVWTFKPKNKNPRGSISNGRQFGTVAGVSGTWNVWVDKSNPPCISYVPVYPTNDLGFDLKHFIDDAKTHGYGINDNQKLTVLFGGTEVWAYGDGLKVTQFCAKVNP